jgi:hypothetical protein
MVNDVLAEAERVTADHINGAGGQALFEACNVHKQADFESMLATCQQQWCWLVRNLLQP